MADPYRPDPRPTGPNTPNNPYYRRDRNVRVAREEESPSEFFGFSPLSLFGAGEQGAWFDPSDLSTLFADEVGSAPPALVPAKIGDPIGLMFDKSQGATPGPNLSNVTAPKTQSSAGEVAGLTEAPEVGAFYLVEYTITASDWNEALYQEPGSGPFGYYSMSKTVGSHSYVFQALDTQTGSFLQMGGVGPFTGSITFSVLSVRKVAGNHATQATLAQRPILRQSPEGLYYLEFDGTDDFMVTSTIAPGTDKAQIFAGVRKLSEATEGIVVEHGVAGQDLLATSLSIPQNGLAWQLVLRDAAQNAIARTGATFPPPQTAVVAGLLDYAGATLADEAKIRVNQAQTDAQTGGQVAGAFGDYPLYLGSRGVASTLLNGHIYGLIVRFGPNLTTEEIENTEGWVAGKTGVTLGPAAILLPV